MCGLSGKQGGKSDGYFVEFGAADGIELSNTYMLEKTMNWRGALAEPRPAFKERLRRNRVGYVSDKCVWTRSDVEIAFVAAHDAFMARIASVVPQGEFETASRGPEVAVRTISLEDLLKDAGSPPVIDYMSVDTEGSELDILSAFDFDTWTVRCLSVEHNFAPVREELHQLLRHHGFRRNWTSFSAWDDWYVNERIV